jgi:hypothetical protein
MHALAENTYCFNPAPGRAYRLASPLSKRPPGRRNRKDIVQIIAPSAIDPGGCNQSVESGASLNPSAITFAQKHDTASRIQLTVSILWARSRLQKKQKDLTPGRSGRRNASAGNRTRGWPITREVLVFKRFSWQRPILPLNHQCCA